MASLHAKQNPPYTAYRPSWLMAKKRQAAAQVRAFMGAMPVRSAHAIGRNAAIMVNFAPRL
jgi:hypothetical protein